MILLLPVPMLERIKASPRGVLHPLALVIRTIGGNGSFDLKPPRATAPLNVNMGFDVLVVDVTGTSLAMTLTKLPTRLMWIYCAGDTVWLKLAGSSRLLIFLHPVSPTLTTQPVFPVPDAFIHSKAPLVLAVSMYLEPTGAETTPLGKPVPVKCNAPPIEVPDGAIGALVNVLTPAMVWLPVVPTLPARVFVRSSPYEPLTGVLAVMLVTPW